MITINKVKKSTYHNFEFSECIAWDDKTEHKAELGGYMCEWNDDCSCGVYLDLKYVRIMEDLKKAGLVAEDHPLICCVCYERYVS